MADYIPVFAPGSDITLMATAAITGGQLLAVGTSDNSVTPTTGATAAWVGVATTDAASGTRVGVASGGVQELIASGAITRGDPVIPAASGKVATMDRRPTTPGWSASR